MSNENPEELSEDVRRLFYDLVTTVLGCSRLKDMESYVNDLAKRLGIELPCQLGWQEDNDAFMDELEKLTGLTADELCWSPLRNRLK